MVSEISLDMGLFMRRGAVAARISGVSRKRFNTWYPTGIRHVVVQRHPGRRLRVECIVSWLTRGSHNVVMVQAGGQKTGWKDLFKSHINQVV
jgi:hypothetical protein